MLCPEGVSLESVKKNILESTISLFDREHHCRGLRNCFEAIVAIRVKAVCSFFPHFLCYFASFTIAFVVLNHESYFIRYINSKLSHSKGTFRKMIVWSVICVLSTPLSLLRIDTFLSFINKMRVDNTKVKTNLTVQAVFFHPHVFLP